MKSNIIHVLHVSAVKTWGGGENQIQNLCIELGNDVVENIILCVKESEFEERLHHLPIRFETAPLSFNLDPRFMQKIIKLVKKYKIDIIHIHDPKALALTVIADKFCNLPPMIYSKKTSFPIRDKKSTLYKYNYKKIQKVLCVSEVTKKVTAQAIEDKNKLITVYDGTRVPKEIKDDVICIRKKIQADENQIIIGNIGNHIEAKDLDTFIKMVDELVNVRQQKQLKFVQIGSFSVLTPAYLEKVEQLNLKNHLYFLNHINQAEQLIPQMDIFVMSSKSEGIPHAIYECAYFKTPVISTNVGGIPEFITHKKEGLLTEPYDYKLLADSVELVLRDDELRSTITENAEEKLLQHFTANKMAEATLTIYREIYENNLS